MCTYIFHILILIKQSILNIYGLTKSLKMNGIDLTQIIKFIRDYSAKQHLHPVSLQDSSETHKKQFLLCRALPILALLQLSQSAWLASSATSATHELHAATKHDQLCIVAEKCAVHQYQNNTRKNSLWKDYYGH